MSEYTEKYTTAELAAELLLIKLTYMTTGTIDKESLTFLLQTSLASDGLLRVNEALEKKNVDLQADLFSKDIEIAELRAQIEELKADV